MVDVLIALRSTETRDYLEQTCTRGVDNFLKVGGGLTAFFCDQKIIIIKKVGIINSSGH